MINNARKLTTIILKVLDGSGHLYFMIIQKERMIPMYRRKQVAKMEKESPQEFQLIPSSGHLLPGQRKNVQVKFMPLEEVELLYISMLLLD